MPRKSTAARSATPLTWGAAQWRALHSPVRFELFALAEGAAPCSVSDLARLSGRRASSLYRHVEALARAGLLEAGERRRAGRRFEAVYDLGPMGRARPVGEEMGRAAAPLGRLIDRAYRAASRDMRAAIAAGHVPRFRDPDTPLHFFFEVTWLDDARRRAINEHALEIARLVREGRAARTGELHQLVSSLAPLPRGRAAAAAARTRSARARR